MIRWSLLSLLIFATGCSSMPLKPEAQNVEVSRERADEDCQEIGKVEGRVSSVKGTFEQALDDLKLDAARKGANFVSLGPSGAFGQSVSGIAYICE